MPAPQTASTEIPEALTNLPRSFKCPFSGIPGALYLEGGHKQLMCYELDGLMRDNSVFLTLFRDIRYFSLYTLREKAEFQFFEYDQAVRTPEIIIYVSKWIDGCSVIV
jgi:hypothetical protein